MLRHPPCTLLLLVALGWALPLLGCKDPETVAQATRVLSAEDRIERGRTLLEQGRADLALAELTQAASVLVADPRPRLLISRAQRQLGNDGASLLALKEAVELSRGSDPGLKKQLADALRVDGHLEQAIAVLVQLRDAGTLSDREVLELARLQAKTGEINAAFKTLEEVQRRAPDDPESKVAEAEILLASGDEKHVEFAVKILDRLVAKDPTHVPTRALRARRLLDRADAEGAAAELDAVAPEARATPELRELQAEVYAAQDRFDEADSLLGALLEERPRDPDLLARLAEVKLSLGSVSTADMLVEQALGVRPKNPRSLYMRGRIMEAQGELDQAQDYYAQALKADNGLVPALSRSWRIHQHRGEKIEAMSTLERLFFMGTATLDDKVALAELYAETRTQNARGQRLIAEAIAKDPKSDRLRQIQKKLIAQGPKKKGRRQEVEVITGRRRR